MNDPEIQSKIKEESYNHPALGKSETMEELSEEIKKEIPEEEVKINQDLSDSD